MSSRFKKRLEQLHGSRQRRRASQADGHQSRVFTAEGVEAGDGSGNDSSLDHAPSKSLPDQPDSLTDKWLQQGAKTRTTPRGEAYFLVRAHPEDHRHGKKRLVEGATTSLGCFRNQLNDARLHSTDPTRLAFLDLETNGLSKSSFPFCIGIGLWEGDSFSVYHYFTPSDEHEPAALSACAEILSDVDGLCTFNGSSFDVRMLDRRFRQHGIEHGLDQLPHLDLLHLARKLWPERKRHKLSSLEEDELGFRRTGDIPGAKIPGRWRTYQKVGEPRLLLDIFDHNRLDVLSMVVLIAELADALEDKPVQDTAARDTPVRDTSIPGTPVEKPRTKLTSRLTRTYALREKALRKKPLREKAQDRSDRRSASQNEKAATDTASGPLEEPQKDRRNVTLEASLSRSTLRKGMPIGTRLRELRAEVERLREEGATDEVLARLHEMVALAPRNPFALQALVDHYRRSGEPALAGHFEKRLEAASPF